MNSTTGLRFLRPYLSPDVPVTRKAIYIRFFNTTRCLAKPSPRQFPAAMSLKKKRQNTIRTVEINKDRAPIEARIKELEAGKALGYPRIRSVPNTLTVVEYQRRYGSMLAGEQKPLEMITVYGMC